MYASCVIVPAQVAYLNLPTDALRQFVDGQLQRGCDGQVPEKSRPRAAMEVHVGVVAVEEISPECTPDVGFGGVMRGYVTSCPPAAARSRHLERPA